MSEKTDQGRFVISANVAFWILVGGIMAWNYYGVGDPALEVVAAANQRGDGAWVVNGHVIYAGQFVEGAQAWAIGEDARGNRYASGAQETGAGGEFELPGLPGVSVEEPLISMTVFARANPPLDPSAADTEEPGKIRYAGWLEDTEILSFSGTRRHRVAKVSVFAVGLLGSLFFVSILVALIPLPEPKTADSKNYWLIGKYITSVILAVVFTAFMIGYVTSALSKVNAATSKQDNEVLSLGFATIYHGRYVSEAEPEWLFSLTSPQFENPSEPDASTAGELVAGNAKAGVDDPFLTKGLGAPLWVLFIAVIGSALFTIAIIVQTIKERVSDVESEELRNRIQAIVMHQFYILFAPLGAIFVFQLMVMLGMAKEVVTIAITTLAAGIALNFLLDAARERMTKLFEKSSTS